MHQEVVWENQTVVIANGKILKVGPSTDTLVRESAKIIDGTGKYLIPGLSEMHYHWRNKEGGIARDFKLLLANGVTTVRNMAEYDWQDHVAIRDSINNGQLMGVCGRLSHRHTSECGTCSHAVISSLGA